MFLMVRGKERAMQMTIPTILKTIEQVPWSVTVFIMVVKVTIWLPIIKIEKRI